MDDPRRVFGIFAHVDAGKTTLTEQLLHLAGEVRRPGSVDGGNTVTDWREDEQARGITIGAAAAHFRWNGVEFDLIDTPGHVDFGVEVDAVLDEIDGAVLVISAPDGPQAQTLAIWRQLRARSLPTVLFINKIDTGHVDLLAVLDAVEAGLGCEAAPLNWPEIEEDDDAFTWYGAWSLLDGGWQPALGTCDADVVVPLGGPAAEVRERLVERLIERDDGLLAAWLDGVAPTADGLRQVLGNATGAAAMNPLVFGAAALGHGVDALLGAVEGFLPGPTLHEAPEPTLRVLKLESRPGGDLLLLGRVLAGPLRQTDVLRGPGETEPLHIAELGRLQGRDLLPALELPTGALAGVRLQVWPRLLPRPGTRLTSAERPDLWQPAKAPRPEPVVWCALDADTPDHHGHLERLLELAVGLDSSLQLRRDHGTGQLFVGGRGELQLEVLHQRLERELAFNVRRGPLRVRRVRSLAAPRTGRAEALDAQTGLLWVLRLALASADAPALTLPIALDPPRQAALDAGLAFAFEVSVDHEDADLAPLSVEIVSLSPSVDTTDLPAPPVLREVASRAITDALRGADWSIHEPWVELTALVPWAAIGRFHGELARRGIGAPVPVESTPAGQRFAGPAPLARVLGLPTIFREFTAGFGWLGLELREAPGG